MRCSRVWPGLVAFASVFAVPARAACPEAPETLQRRAQAEADPNHPWPAWVEGEPIHRTFRFRPSWIRYAFVDTVIGDSYAVFGIAERRIPADYFVWHVDGRDAYQPQVAVKKLLAKGGGLVTVDARGASGPEGSTDFHRCTPAPGSRPGKQRSCTFAGRVLWGALVLPGEKPARPIDRTRPVTHAAVAGDVAALRALLDGGGDVNEQDSDDETPLTCAIRRGKIETVKVLLAAKARTDLGRDRNGTAVLAAIIAERPDILKLLLEAGASPNLGRNDGSPLFFAVSRGAEAVELLLAAGADVEVGDGHGRTPLLWAATRSDSRDARAADVLLRAGANPNAADASGRTPLLEAVGSGDVALAERLLSAGADRRAKGLFGSTAIETALHAAGRGLRCAQMEAVLQGGGAGGTDVDGQVIALAAGWPVAVDPRSLSPRVYRFRPAWHQYWPKGDGRPAGVIAFKIEDPAVPADYFYELPGWSPTRPPEPALVEGYARSILEDDHGFLDVGTRGFAPSEADAPGPAAACLPSPCRPVKGRVRVLQGHLVARGGARPPRGHDPVPALIAAAASGDVHALRSQLAAQPDREVRDAEGGNTALLGAVAAGHREAARILLEAGADPNAVNKARESVLGLAVANRDHELLRRLLAAGADPSLGRWRQPALLHAVLYADAEAVDILLRAGADVNGREKAGGNTALMEAARQGNVAIARRLLDAGAVPDGATLVVAARESYSVEVVRLLLGAGAGRDPVQTAKALELARECATVGRKQASVALLLQTRGPPRSRPPAAP